MRISKLLALAASVSFLAGTSSAQVVTVSVANSWAINTDSGAVASNDFLFLTGSGNDFLNINSFSTGGRSDHGPAGLNQTQSNVQGTRGHGVPLSGGTMASTHSFASYLWGGAGLGTATATANCVASGVLPPLQNVNMSGSSRITFILGIFGTTISASTTSSATVSAPQVFGGGLGAVNRLLVSQGPPIGGTIQLAGFYYSSLGDANSNATLKKKQDAFFNTNVFANATISLF